MAYSYVSYTGDGSTKNFSIPFGYIQSSHLTVTVAGVAKVEGTDYSVSGGTLSFVTAPASSAAISVVRSSSPSARLVTFTDGTVPLAADLNKDGLQAIYLAEEILDGGGSGNMSAATYDPNSDGVIAVAQGGTGATTAAAARTALGSTTVGDAVFTAANAAAARTATGAAPDSLTATGTTTARTLEDRCADIANVKDFGAVGNGTTDDTSAIQAAINAGLNVFLPAGSYKITAALNLRAGSQFIGAGRGVATLVLPSAAAFNAVVATSIANVRIADFSITGGGLAASLNYWGVLLDTCTDSVVERVKVYDVDCVCVRFRDSQRCVARNIIGSYSPARYAARTAGWVVEFDGCSACTMDACHGSSCHFGFIILANDGLGVSGNQSDSARTRSLCTGNRAIGCTVDGFTGVGFDINACDGNTITGCSAQNYTDSVGVDVAAFQNKHSTDVNSRGNAFVGCTAKSVGSGFYSQDGSRCTFSGCTVKDAQYQGFWLNAAPYCVISGCVVDRFGAANAGAQAVRIEAGSHSSVVDGMVVDVGSSTGTLIGFYFDNSDGCLLDNVQCVGSFTNQLKITATADNTGIGRNARVGGTAIDDVSSTTIYPIRARSQEIALSGGGADYPFDYFPRGMRIARIQLVTTVAVTGTTPKGRAGRQGSTAAYLALTNFGTSIGPVAVLAASLTSSLQDGGSGHVIYIGTDGTATTGKGFVVVEGVELQN